MEAGVGWTVADTPPDDRDCAIAPRATHRPADTRAGLDAGRVEPLPGQGRAEARAGHRRGVRRTPGSGVRRHGRARLCAFGGGIRRLEGSRGCHPRAARRLAVRRRVSPVTERGRCSRCVGRGRHRRRGALDWAPDDVVVVRGELPRGVHLRGAVAHDGDLAGEATSSGSRRRERWCWHKDSPSWSV